MIDLDRIAVAAHFIGQSVRAKTDFRTARGGDKARGQAHRAIPELQRGCDRPGRDAPDHRGFGSHAFRARGKPARKAKKDGTIDRIGLRLGRRECGDCLGKQQGRRARHKHDQTFCSWVGMREERCAAHGGARRSASRNAPYCAVTSAASRQARARSASMQRKYRVTSER